MLSIQTIQKITSKVIGEIARPFGMHQVRWARRTCKKRPWHVERNVSPFWHNRELTRENKDFLKDSHLTTVPIHRPLLNSMTETKQWDTNTHRTGVLAVKIGVVPQWTSEGQKFFCTLLQVLDNHVIKCQSNDNVRGKKKKFLVGKENMKPLIVGALGTSTEKFTKQYCGLFNEAGVLPKRKLTRYFVSPEALLQPGTPIDVTHFNVGNYVDLQAKTIGHGFQGVVKRHKFKGGPASHGNTKWHRRPGNIGGGRGKGKVFKGKKLPGHMGMEWATTRGLKIWRINTKYNVLYVHGQAVPGPTHCYVRIYDTVTAPKRILMLANPPPVPTSIQEKTETIPEEIFDKDLFKFSESFSAISVGK